MTVAHELVADESFNRKPADILYGAGVRILVVYPWGNGKAITKAEWDAYLRYRAPDGGRLALVVVDEHGNQQMLSGPGFGTQIANENMAFSAALQPELKATRPLYYVADDPNPLPAARWAEVADRFREICAAHLAAGWVLPGDTFGNSLVGGYGSGPLLEYLFSHHLVGWVDGGRYGWLWPVFTWGPCPHAAFYQDPNTRLDRLGNAIDWDYLADGVADIGQYPPPDGGFLMGLSDNDQNTVRDDVIDLHEAGGRIESGLNTLLNSLWPGLGARLDAIEAKLGGTAAGPVDLDALASLVVAKLAAKLGA